MMENEFDEIINLPQRSQSAKKTPSRHYSTERAEDAKRFINLGSSAFFGSPDWPAVVVIDGRLPFLCCV
jgi:hypothetical protein